MHQVQRVSPQEEEEEIILQNRKENRNDSKIIA